MALTLPRWIAVAVAGFVLLPVIILREPEERTWNRSARDQLHDRIRRTRSQVERAAERQYVLLLHDSVRTALAATRSAGPQTRIDARFSAVTRAKAMDLVRDASVGRPMTPNVTTDIVVLLDTGSHFRGLKRRRFPGALALDYLLPRRGTSDHCVVIARVWPNRTMELGSYVSRERLLGPCAFYEAFGHPGERVDGWLRTRGWQLGRLANWQGEGSRWNPPRWYPGRREDYDLRWILHETGFACLSGSDTACASGVLLPARSSRSRVYFTGVVSTADYNPFLQGDNPWFSADWPFGSQEPRLLADMVRGIGPERFAEFWRSSLAPQDAFRQATGAELAHWVRDWMERVYHPQTSGPDIARATLGTGLLLVILGAAVSMRAAQRRQVL